jgi:hypothetical protein
MTEEVQPTPEHAQGTRAPFIDKNLAALKIGSRSPRVYGKVAEALTADLLHEAPHLAQYPEELAALASTEALAALMRMEIAARGIRNKDGSERLAFLDRYFRAEAAAAKRRDALGLSPIGEATLARERASAAALATSAAVDLEALARRGRQALEARDGQADLVASVVNSERAEYEARRGASAADWEATATPRSPSQPSPREDN